MVLRRAGFTLIELLIVIIVLGVLAAAALPRYQSFVVEARTRNCLTNLRNIEQSVGVWETRNFTIPSSKDYPWACFGTSPTNGDIDSTLCFGGDDNTAATTQAYAGPKGGKILEIVQEARSFLCPEILNRYGEVANIPFNKDAGVYTGYAFATRFDATEVKPTAEFGGGTRKIQVKELFRKTTKRNATCLSFGLPKDGDTPDTSIITLPNGVTTTIDNTVFQPGMGPDLTADFVHYPK